MFIFLVKTEPMSSSEIVSTTADGSLDNFSGSGKEEVLDFYVNKNVIFPSLFICSSMYTRVCICMVWCVYIYVCTI